MDREQPVTRCLATLTISTVSPRFLEDGKPALSISDYMSHQSTRHFDNPPCLDAIVFEKHGEHYIFEGVALPQGDGLGFLIAARLSEGGNVNSGPIFPAP
ncbi:MAG: hypothetical protein NWP98_05350 [Erythrobacter sp.]|nr:hypothetical protein [Erythrobacter sp.]